VQNDSLNTPDCVSAVDREHSHVNWFLNSGHFISNTRTVFRYWCWYVQMAMSWLLPSMSEISVRTETTLCSELYPRQILEKEELCIQCLATLPMDEKGRNVSLPLHGSWNISAEIQRNDTLPENNATKQKTTLNYRLSRVRKNIECTFVILNAKFVLFEGPVCCKQETVNSVVKRSVVLHNSSTIGKGLLYEIGERSAVNQPDFRILHEEDGR
jgi:hypothetical protein